MYQGGSFKIIKRIKGDEYLADTDNIHKVENVDGKGLDYLTNQVIYIKTETGRYVFKRWVNFNENI